VLLAIQAQLLVVAVPVLRESAQLAELAVPVMDYSAVYLMVGLVVIPLLGQTLSETAPA
jgi:hypothetical protein